jgi:hypothetical protein
MKKNVVVVVEAANDIKRGIYFNNSIKTSSPHDGNAKTDPIHDLISRRRITFRIAGPHLM